MKTELQRNLAVFLEYNMNKEIEMNSDTLTIPNFKGNEVSPQSSQRNQINTITQKLNHSLRNGYITDTQIINRLCALRTVPKEVKINLLSLCDKNPEKCAKEIVDIIYSGEAHNIPFKTKSTDIESDISNEQAACFYKELNEWVEQAGEGEDRIKAQELIVFAYENNEEVLDLSSLKLTSIPSAIIRLQRLTEINIAGNRLSTFPECLYSFSTLERINIASNYIDKLTAGMRMLISKFDCDIKVDEGSSDKPSNIYKELCYFKEVFIDNKKKGLEFGEPEFDEEAHISIVNKEPLRPEVEEILTESYHKTMLPKTQGEFMESFGKCEFKKKRVFLTKDNPVNVIGCSGSFCEVENKTEYNKSLEFIYQNVDVIFLLIPRNGDKEKLEFIKNCSGNDAHRLTQVISIPIIDFYTPRLEHYEIILDKLKNNKPIAQDRPKTIMISCDVGEGRTGTCLAMLKLVDEFKLLPESEKKDLIRCDRFHGVAPRSGFFSRFDGDHKTTDFVAGVIDSIRINEEKSLGGAISIETPDQAATLELMQIILAINHTQQTNPLMTDDDIVELIYSNGFSKDCISAFGDSYFTKPVEGVLTDAEMLKAAESKILRIIRNIHTII